MIVLGGEKYLYCVYILVDDGRKGNVGEGFLKMRLS